MHGAEFYAIAWPRTAAQIGLVSLILIISRFRSFI